jgi:hypothetical protein
MLFSELLLRYCFTSPSRGETPSTSGTKTQKLPVGCTSLAGPSDRSSVAKRVIPKKNLRHRSHSPDTVMGHCTLRDPAKHPTRSSLLATSDPRPRSARQSIPIGHALGNGLVQPMSRPPSRRSPSDCSPGVFPPRRRSKPALHHAKICIIVKTGSTSDNTLTLKRPQTEDARRIIRSAYQSVTTKLQLPEIDLFDEFDWLRVFRVVSIRL